ncbi:MAG: uracil-DNA glycosylase [Christensenellales bacterium]|jgi:uracil-DNA glycosylase family 4
MKKLSLKTIFSNMLEAATAYQKSENDMVFGEGNTNARIMLIGEAPGAEETRLSQPFVGQAGKNLDVFLYELGQARRDIYITNVVKFRPYKISAKGTVSNRPPTSGEIACMLPHLLREIEAVSPEIVVTLGNVPLRCILQNRKATIGTYHAVPTAASALSHTFILFPLYHPASVIYNPSLKSVYMQDIIHLKQYIEAIKTIKSP